MRLEAVFHTVVRIVTVIAVYLWHAVRATGIELFALFGPLIVLGVPAGLVSGMVQRRLVSKFGLRPTVYALCWLGTPIHELSHAAFAVLFRHRIQEIVLFDFDPRSGHLGHVNHAFNPNSHYQMIGNLFIGIAPVLVGGVLLALGAHLALGPQLTEAARSAATVAGSTSPGVVLHGAWGAIDRSIRTLGAWAAVPAHWTQWKTWVFAFFALSIASNMALSGEDIYGASVGAGYLLGFLLVVNLLTVWIGDFGTRIAAHVGALTAPLYPALAFALVLETALLLFLAAFPWSALAAGAAIGWRACA